MAERGSTEKPCGVRFVGTHSTLSKLPSTVMRCPVRFRSSMHCALPGALVKSMKKS
jgi:hypothetical protein